MMPDQRQRVLGVINSIDALCREMWESRDPLAQPIRRILTNALTELHLAISLTNGSMPDDGDPDS